MKAAFVIISTFILSIFALLWNGLVHLVILADDNKAVEALHRSDMSDKFWLSVLVTVFIAFLFSVNFIKWRKSGKISETIFHSLFFAALMFVVVDLNQYCQYAIPFSLILKWSCFGIAEFILYGLILHFLGKKMLQKVKQ